MGWATITHPFHPLRGQRFEVLKTRRAGGIDTLLLRHAERGSYAIARDWTDWSLSEPVAMVQEPVHRLAAQSLLEMAAVVAELSRQCLDELDECAFVDHAQTS